MSATRTMISATIPKNRVINKFPQAFHADATPYQQLNFDPQVKAACAENRTGRVGLKICKAVLVGDVAVGKTSLVNRFCHDIFDRDYKATIGVDFEVEKFQVLSIPFTLQVWDTAGQERFKCIAASYYRGANVVLVAFDLTDEVSLANTQRWMEDSCKSADEPVKFLIGLKKDLLSNAAYHEIEARAILVANKIGAEYWAISSKTGENLTEFFFRAVALTFDVGVQREIQATSSQPSRRIGSLIHVNAENPDIYEKKRSRESKCCSS